MKRNSITGILKFLQKQAMNWKYYIDFPQIVQDDLELKNIHEMAGITLMLIAKQGEFHR